MSRSIFTRTMATFALTLTCAAGAHAQVAPAKAATTVPAITVYKDPNCGCCKNWVEHLRRHGFHVIAKDVTDMGRVKDANHVPARLVSCHTALINGYVIEGHVPAAMIEKLLKEHPAIAGLSVPGMPMGSPGMDMPGHDVQPYDVVAFKADGTSSVYARITTAQP